ncbi:ROK family protein [Natribacillus halophilus]|uniref:Glucokinase n=1 Tax=Natribacillus halophilus TaxID=549003 RepID=A0A1G8JQ37_9BACI|nr:ROK family protein [Natribacillus halophilus]SDI32680.1 glucokinase [Natribacillus halophilus]
MTKYIVGVDVGGTSTKFGVFTPEGEKLTHWKISTDTDDDARHFPARIASSIEKRLLDEGIAKEERLGVGVGVPGFIDETAGIVHNAVNIGWHDYPLQATLAEALDIPVFINNDANLAAAGEYWQGAGKKEASTLFITLGTGVGGGMIINGNLVTGPRGTAGEIGHTLVVPHGRLCTCGREGCLEEYVAAKGLRRSLHDHLRNDDGPSPLHENSEAIDIYKAAEAGDALATRIVDEAAYYLAYALANAATIVNPEKIVIGGGVSAAGQTLLQPVVAHFKRLVLKEADRHLAFEFARLGNDAGIYGGAWLALRRLGR